MTDHMTDSEIRILLALDDRRATTYDAKVDAFPDLAREVLRLRDGLSEIKNLVGDTEPTDAKVVELTERWTDNLLAGRAWNDGGTDG